MREFLMLTDTEASNSIPQRVLLLGSQFNCTFVNVIFSALMAIRYMVRFKLYTQILTI